MSSYTDAKKRYNEKHKAEIAEKEKEKKRWVSYYAENKEEISKRRKALRLAKELPRINEEQEKRYKELMAEAETLKKAITAKKIRDAAIAKREAEKAKILPADNPGVAPEAV
jgi:hypothetical protein